MSRKPVQIELEVRADVTYLWTLASDSTIWYRPLNADGSGKWAQMETLPQKTPKKPPAEDSRGPPKPPPEQKPESPAEASQEPSKEP